MRFCTTLFLLALCTMPSVGWSGGEETEEKKLPAPKSEPMPAPLVTVEPEPELPAMSLVQEAPPEFKEEKLDLPAPTAPKKKAREPWDPDKNVSYTEILGHVNPDILQNGVLQPALGFRGYMPSMLAANFWHLAPGYGLQYQYNWNRLGVGIYYSYRRMSSTDITPNGLVYQAFTGAYVLYRWLPFDISPHFQAGVESAVNTPEQVGPTAGVGVEARIWEGITLLFGYTFHSTIHTGTLGGEIGWSF